MENEIMQLKITVAMANTVIYFNAQPCPQKNKLHNLHPLVLCYCSFVFVQLDFERRVRFILYYKVSFHQRAHPGFFKLLQEP